jgi:hypothetical protein
MLLPKMPSSLQDLEITVHKKGEGVVVHIASPDFTLPPRVVKIRYEDGYCRI